MAHLVNKGAKVVSVVGCSPINKACFTAIRRSSKASRRWCFDLFLDKANEFAQWVHGEYGVEALGVDDTKASFREVDVITVAASRLKPLYFKDEWVKQGATILISGKPMSRTRSPRATTKPTTAASSAARSSASSMPASCRRSRI